MATSPTKPAAPSWDWATSTLLVTCSAIITQFNRDGKKSLKSSIAATQLVLCSRRVNQWKTIFPFANCLRGWWGLWGRKWIWAHDVKKLQYEKTSCSKWWFTNSFTVNPLMHHFKNTFNVWVGSVEVFCDSTAFQMWPANMCNSKKIIFCQKMLSTVIAGITIKHFLKIISHLTLTAAHTRHWMWHLTSWDHSSAQGAKSSSPLWIHSDTGSLTPLDSYW